jgi:DNA-binding response OmpR family regulator
MKAGSSKILCVEDDRDTAALIAEDLGDRGYDVTLVYDGREGLEAMLREPPDLALVDINIPAMTGLELLERVTALAPRFERTPFVFLTALRDRDTELAAWRLGADGYVTKPVDFEMLGALIAARLRRVPPRTERQPIRTDLLQRELETLTWAGRGKTSAEIAEILGLRKRTVDFHIERARGKLGVATRMQAVMKATSGRLIRP